MRVSRLMLVGLLLLLPVLSLADELPEPSVADIQYECEIGFGTFAGIVWQPQPIQYQVVDGVVTGTHAYWSTLGIQRFEAQACTPNKKVVFQFEINQLPEGLPFIFYRVRIRGYLGATKGEWSEPSYWVGIINLPAPGRPVR